MRDPVDAPRFRMPFDPVFDLMPVRAAYTLRQALNGSPDDATTLLLLAECYRQRSMFEQALPLYRRLATLDPPSMMRERVEQVRQLATDQAARCLAELLPEPPEKWQNRDELERSLRADLATGRAESAALLLEKAYPVEARPWPVADRLATLWLHLGHPTQARAVWRAAVDVPQPAVADARIAASYLAEDDFDSARQSYREAIRKDQTLFEVHYGLAVLEQDAGHALAAYDAALRAALRAPNKVAEDAARLIVEQARPYVDLTGSGVELKQ